MRPYPRVLHVCTSLALVCTGTACSSSAPDPQVPQLSVAVNVWAVGWLVRTVGGELAQPQQLEAEPHEPPTEKDLELLQAAASAILALTLMLIVLAYQRETRQLAKIPDRASDPDGIAPIERLLVRLELRRSLFERAGLALIVAGVVFTYAQLRTTQDQLEIDRQAQVTDRQAHAGQRLAEATLHIGSRSEDDQILGIHGLRSLAADEGARGNVSYYALLDETLTAFIRTHRPCQPCPTEARPTSRVVQAALSALGTQRPDQANVNKRIDLRYIDLRGVDLSGLHLARTDFRHSNLSGADLTGAHVEGADLRSVVFDKTTGRDTVFDDDQTRWS